MNVTVGTPATINLYTDSIAAVVVKVNKKSVVVRRVETGPRVKDMMVDGANDPNCPSVMVAEGILSKPVGEPERYPLVGTRYRQGSISLTLGKSVSVTDYRY